MPRDYRNARADAWYQEITQQPECFPFGFTYDGVRYEGFGGLALLARSCETREDKCVTICKWQVDPSLTVSLSCAHYPRHGAVEWTVWFENPADHDSGIIEKAETILQFQGARPVLKGILGDHVNKYRPYSVELNAMPAHFESHTGRATHINFPYFNLEYGNGGTMLAIGWAGTWTADFRSVGDVTTYRANAVNNLHTRLKPGEKIRTALFVRADYTVRDEHYATNFWRSWFVESNLPRADSSGTLLSPFSTCCLSSDTGLPNSDGSISERSFTWRPSLEKMIEEDVKVDYRWFDAGWYEAPDGTSPETDWWGTVGTWKLDPQKWPEGSFRESTDFARANGMKTLMWFEPERITDPESLVKNHGYQREWAIERVNETAISNNIGILECYDWIVKRVTSTLRENRVELYREDNNSDPAANWEYLDGQEGADRQGISECKFIDAHYRMWDDFIACTSSYGGCAFVDSCASGGGRNDLESLRRSVPLLRSDSDRTSAALRLSMTTAFNKWIPFCGANTKEKIYELDATGVSDPYVWRASYLPSLNVDSQFVQDPDQDFGVLRFGLKEWKRVAPYLLKEYYVLTAWHFWEDTTGFTAFSYYDPDQKKGVLLAFRQERCAQCELCVTLPYVKKGTVCVLTDEDTGEVCRVSGETMENAGLTLSFGQPRMARLLWVSVEEA